MGRAKLRLSVAILVSLLVLLLGLLYSSEWRTGWQLAQNRHIEAVKTSRGFPLPWITDISHVPMGETPPDYALPPYVPEYDEFRPGFAIHYRNLGLAIASSVVIGIVLVWLALSARRDIRMATARRNLTTMTGVIVVGLVFGLMSCWSVPDEQSWLRAGLVVAIVFVIIPGLITILVWWYRSYAAPILACAAVWLLFYAANRVGSSLGLGTEASTFDDESATIPFFLNVGLLLLAAFFRFEFGRKAKEERIHIAIAAGRRQDG